MRFFRVELGIIKSIEKEGFGQYEIDCFAGCKKQMFFKKKDK